MLSCESLHDRDAFDIDNIIAKASAYNMEIAALEKKADESVDIASAYRFATMAKNLKKDGNKKIHEIFELLPEPVTFKVEQDLKKQIFTISNLEITSMDLSAISMEALIKVSNPDSIHSIKIHLCGIDKTGTQLKPCFYLNGFTGDEHKTEIPVSGKLQNSEKFTGLVKFRVVGVETSGSYQFPNPQ